MRSFAPGGVTPLVPGGMTPLVPGAGGGGMTPGMAGQPPAGVGDQRQQWVMNQIVRGMSVGDIGVVAVTLREALQAQVTVPETFLSTVKLWMDQRSRQAVQQPQVPTMPHPMQQPAMAQGQTQAFAALQGRLDAAIARNDPAAIKAVLAQGAQFAQAYGGAATPLASAVGGFGAMTPNVLGGVAAPGAGVAFPAPGAATPLYGMPGGATPLGAGFVPGGATPMIGQGAATPQLGAATPQIPGMAPFAGAPAQAAPEPPVPSAGQDMPTIVPSLTKEELGIPPPPPSVELPTILPGETKGKARRADGGKKEKKGKKQRPIMTKQQYSPTDLAREFGLPEDPASRPQPTADEIAEYLRGRPGETALFKSMNSHFNLPGREYLRKVVEGDPTRFILAENKVTLKQDPKKKEALNKLCKELVRAHMTRRKIIPDAKTQAGIYEAANLALQGSPMGVARILEHVAKHTLRHCGMVSPGRYPANFPLVSVCIIDRIVTLERRSGGKARIFEKALGPVIKSIFKRWTLGMVPGSQFLANVLLTWERLGYFRSSKAKYIEECKTKVLLLVAYARREGVPDGADKEKGEGWYRIVQRPPGVAIAGCEAILPDNLRKDEDDDQVLRPPAPASFGGEPAAPGTLPLSEEPPAAVPAAGAPQEEAPARERLPQLDQPVIAEATTVDSEAARELAHPEVATVGTADSGASVVLSVGSNAERGGPRLQHPEVATEETPGSVPGTAEATPPGALDAAAAAAAEKRAAGDAGSAQEPAAKRSKTGE